MPNQTKKAKVSGKVKEDAMKIARATQRPGQTKEQTKLISQGIQKGIEQYKKLHKDKARELDKRLKAELNKLEAEPSVNQPIENDTTNNKLPWVLLIISWLGFATYFVIKKFV